MNRLSIERRAKIIACLVEGMSINGVRCTPAMEAGVDSHLWSIEEIAALAG